MGSATLVLAILLALAILRPALPARAHDVLFNAGVAAQTEIVRAPVQTPDLGDYLTRTGAPALATSGWSEQLVTGSLEPSQVKAMEEERFFAVRRYKLNDGRRVVLFTEVGGEPRNDFRIPVSAVREF